MFLFCRGFGGQVCWIVSFPNNVLANSSRKILEDFELKINFKFQLHVLYLIYFVNAIRSQ